MTGILSGLAANLLRMTTAPDGQSTLPAWIAASLALFAGVQPPQNPKPGSVDERLVWQAVTMYQAASGRRGPAQTPAAWQIGAEGTQAVQVLPQPQNELQRRVLLQLESLVQSTTINHPRLAPVFRTAFSQGYPYLAARLDQGAQALTKRFGLPVDPEQALRITQQVAEALEYAHHRGVIHGSLSLDDILVRDNGQLTVLGVGVEQLRNVLGAPSAAPATALTPPEVRAGGQADTRADVFAVGALLFVLLTGKMPTAGKAVTLSQELPVLPPALDAVLTKALASDPADRYADLFAMSHDLSMATRSPRAAVKPPASPPGKTPRSAASRARAASQPAPAISGFPEPMPMPAIDMAIFDQPLQMPEIASAVATAMPAPPPVPTVDWDSLLQPADPMLAAVQAVRSVDSRPPRPTRSQSTRQRTAAAPAQASAPAAAPPPSPGRGARRRKRTK